MLGVQCVACQARRKHKGLRYHPETFEPYCENPYLCNEQHPNSPVNLISRKTQVHLYTYEEAQSKYVAEAIFEKSDKLKRLLNQPVTFRITSAEMAEFLVDESEATGQSISEIVRGYIQSMMGGRVKVTTIKTSTKEEPKYTVTDDDLIF